MSCEGCGSSVKSRHAPKVTIVGDVDSKAKEVAAPYPRQEPKPRNTFHSGPPIDFKEAEKITRAMSFEELEEAVAKRKDDIIKTVEMDLSAMTPAIKRLHVVSLIEVANYEPNPLLAMTPDQAVVNLKVVLDREDFNEINVLYPSLKEQVNMRYKDLISKRFVV